MNNVDNMVYMYARLNMYERMRREIGKNPWVDVLSGMWRVVTLSIYHELKLPMKDAFYGKH